MTAQSRKLTASRFTIIRAALLLTTIGLLLVVLYFYFSNAFIPLRLKLLNDPLILIYPEPVLELLEREKLIGIAIATLFIGANYAGTAFGVFLVVSTGLRLHDKRYKKEDKTPLDRKNDIFTLRNVEATLCLIRPQLPDGEVEIDKKSAPRGYYLFKRASVPNLNKKPVTKYDLLEKALLEILYAHKDVPACPNGHHADTNMFDHSLRVAKKMRKHADSDGLSDPLIGAIGLAHDLSKIVCYRQDEGKWAASSKYHRQHSARIFASLPESRALDHEEWEACIRVLRYSHTVEELPGNATDRQKRLLSILRRSDAGATSYEARNGIVSHEKTLIEQELYQGFLASISELDINQFKGGIRVDGWTTPNVEYVAIPENNLREAVSHHISQSTLRKTRLVIGSNDVRTNEGAQILQSALLNNQILLTKHRDHESSTGLFSIRAGARPFVAVYLLDRKKLSEMFPNLVERWGTTKYRPRVLSPWPDPVEVTGDD